MLSLGKHPFHIQRIDKNEHGEEGDAVVDDAVPVSHVIGDEFSVHHHAIAGREDGVGEREEDALVQHGGDHACGRILQELDHGMGIPGKQVVGDRLQIVLAEKLKCGGKLG